MKIFLTGGTGFVGSEVLRQLVAAGHVVRALVRKGSETRLAMTENVEIHAGDVTDAGSLVGALEGCDAVIHLVGIIREFPASGITFEKLHVEATRNVLKAAREQAVQRYLHMSSNGTREHSNTGYHSTKWRAEKLVHDSGMQWTIFRPSLIFGPGSEFIEILTKLIRQAPVIPVIGDGQYRMQPVSVTEVADSFVKALKMPGTIGATYHLGGGASYSYDEILDLTAQAMGHQKTAKIHQPLFMIKPMVKMLQGNTRFPITSDQLTMLIEGNVCDNNDWVNDFGLEPQNYARGIETCLERKPC